MRVLITLVVAAGVAVGISRVRGGRAEADLWHEATAPPRTGPPVPPLPGT